MKKRTHHLKSGQKVEVPKFIEGQKKDKKSHKGATVAVVGAGAGAALAALAYLKNRKS